VLFVSLCNRDSLNLIVVLCARV